MELTSLANLRSPFKGTITPNPEVEAVGRPASSLLAPKTLACRVRDAS